MCKEHLLKELTQLDFMAADIGLYLDTHPQDKDALENYHDIAMQAKKVRKQYENLYGPLYAHHQESKTEWNWIDEPWPWCQKFNQDTNERGGV